MNLTGTVTTQPTPFDGSHAFAPGATGTGTANQLIDLLQANVSASQIDNGELDLSFGGRVRSAVDDRGQISVRLLDAMDQVLDSRTVEAQNLTDRWELVGDRIRLVPGTRKVEYEFFASRQSGANTDSFLDNAFLYVLPDAFATDMGATGNTGSEESLRAQSTIQLRTPDLYVDWERDRSHTIAWDSFGNLSDSSVRIDLYQDSADGPAFLTTIATATPDDGKFEWTPANDGIDYGTHGLRVQVSLVDDPIVFDRGTESFSVPENTLTYFVNDASTTGDEYTTVPGSNRQTGRLPSAPKPSLNALFRNYGVSSGAEVFVDTGDYPLLESVFVSATVGLGDDEGFDLAGPTGAAHVARMSPANPLASFPAIELNNADLISIAGLTLENAERGIYAHSGVEGLRLNDVQSSNHTLEGFYLAGQIDVLENLNASNNGADGIYVSGTVDSVMDILAESNDGDGVDVDGTTTSATHLVARFNQGNGLALAGLGELFNSRAENNQQDGFRLSGSVGVVQRNVAIANGCLWDDRFGGTIGWRYGPVRNERQPDSRQYQWHFELIRTHRRQRDSWNRCREHTWD